MNKNKRQRLIRASGLLDTAHSIVSSVRSEEEDALNNTPENLENSERALNMDTAVDTLYDVCDCIKDAIVQVSEVIDL